MPAILLAVAVLLGGWRWSRGSTAPQRRGGLMLLFVPFIANRITGIIKVLVERVRPLNQVPEIEHLR